MGTHFSSRRCDSYGVENCLDRYVVGPRAAAQEAMEPSSVGGVGVLGGVLEGLLVGHVRGFCVVDDADAVNANGVDAEFVRVLGLHRGTRMPSRPRG